MVLAFAAAWNQHRAGARGGHRMNFNSTEYYASDGSSSSSRARLAPPRDCCFFAVALALIVAFVGTTAFGVTRVLLAVNNSRGPEVRPYTCTLSPHLNPRPSTLNSPFILHPIPVSMNPSP
jgi:hypothetical protein